MVLLNEKGRRIASPLQLITEYRSVCFPCRFTLHDLRSFRHYINPSRPGTKSAPAGNQGHLLITGGAQVAQVLVELGRVAGHVGDLDHFGYFIFVYCPAFGVQDDLAARFELLEIDEYALPGVPAHIIVVSHEHDIAALARIDRGQGLANQVQTAAGGKERVCIVLDDAAGIPILAQRHHGPVDSDAGPAGTGVGVGVTVGVGV